MFISSTVETIRGFTASMIDRGADMIYLFNHHYPVSESPGDPAYGPEKSPNLWGDMLRNAGSLANSLKGPRRHILSYHQPVPTGSAYREPLPAAISADRLAKMRIHSGPRPESGRYVVRVGLGESADLAAARLSARLNGEPCRPIADIPRPAEPPSLKQNLRFRLGDLAPRMLQFEAPLKAVRRGYNSLDLFVETGGPQTVVWMEIYVAL